jgi:predicted XRE-type DNA-binding protein
MMENQLTQWKLARLLGVSESTVNRMIREELPEEEQDRIVRLIEEGGL